MTRTLTLLSLAAGLCLPAPAQNLFNGTDLTGWDGDPELWRVEDGAIVGETTADKKVAQNTFLIWKGASPGDFIIEFKARVTGQNNSGFQYRSRVLDPEKWVVGGYQMDLHPAPDYIGMLYEEKGRGILAQRGQRVTVDVEGKPHVVGSLARDGDPDLAEWHDYSVTARGNRLIHRIDGRIVAEVIDNDTVKGARSGIFAFQLHAGPPMRVEIKDVVLRGGRTQRQEAAARPQFDGPVPNWIWTVEEPSEAGKVYLRRTWELSREVKSAVLEITADNGFTAFVNGQPIGSGDRWEDLYRFDVKKVLRTGVNAIAVEASNSGGTAGLAARVVLESFEGRKAWVATNDKWRASEREIDGWRSAEFDDASWPAAQVVARMGAQPWGNVFAGRPRDGQAARGVPEAKVEGFEVERIYTVPKGDQGSWVAMAVDDKGRLYCGDQGGKGIFRVTLGGAAPVVEKIPAEITGAQGMEWAFGALYVCLNGGKPGSGLYRVTDSDGDDSLDKVEELRRFNGGGEHGPHAVVLAPDGESLYVLGGNHTAPPDPEGSAVVPNYGEDQLLPRMPDARGHASNVRAPGGWVARTDEDGKAFEFFSAGFRNQYDVAFNADGEMFTYDSDMEWDSGTPWYRPTRVCHVTSGSEFGWRTGTGKFPVWYPDTLPPVVDIGPGSPTGMVSGLGAKFPAKYQDAVYAFDWTYGTIYAIHLTPEGASYSGVKEEFVVGVPLNVTDGVIGKDGNFYFAVGGRGTDSALYRVRYAGDEPTDWRPRGNKLAHSLRHLRKEMEAFHGGPAAGAIDAIWPQLGNEDRHVRYAARVALEHQPVSDWAERALAEEGVQSALSALLALARQGDAALQVRLLEAMSRLPASGLSEDQKLEALRVLGLCFIRMGAPDPETAAEVAAALNPLYPATSDALNRELVALLVYLNSPDVVAKTLPLLAQESLEVEGLELGDELLSRSGYGKAFAQTQESNPQRQQIWYAYALKNVPGAGWTPEARREFFRWFAKAKNFKGGASFDGFIENFRNEALAKVADETLRAELDAMSKAAAPLVPDGFAEARAIRVGVLPGMKFATEELAAGAGEKLAITLVNDDPAGLMHNLAICAPGAREKVVAAALTIGPKAIEQNFVPDIPEVLASTPQVAPGRKYTLYFTAPNEPGEYPYVCTYPGHGQVMHGVLRVE